MTNLQLYNRYKPRILSCTSLLFVLTMSIMTSCKKDDDTDNGPSTSTNSDTAFIQKVSLANKAEIQLGQLAASKAVSNGIKTFGNMMVTEHQTAENELSTLAAKKQVTLQTALDAEHIALKNKLSALNGFSFDSLYISSQVKDHQKTQQDFQQEISKGTDQEVKNYAIKFLPHITEHLEHATRLRDSVLNVYNNTHVH